MTTPSDTPLIVPAEAPPVTPARPGMAPLARGALIAAGLLLALGGGYAAWHAWSGTGDGVNQMLTAAVTQGDLEDTITATGTLQPKDFVDVGTQVSGQLKRVLVELGAQVKARDLLAEIDPSVYQSKVDADRAQLRNQGAQLADRRAQLVLAERQFTRQKNMLSEDATTADAEQSAEAAATSARAQVDSVKAQIEQTASTLRGDEANLSYTRIYAPIAGTVVSQAAKQGQTLNANQQAPIVLRIADLSVMTVQAQVSEADVSRLQVGMQVYFTTLGSKRRHYGALRQIPPTPTVVNNVVLYDALFDVLNPDRKLMTQMTAQVFFVLASAKGALQVPLTALRPAGTSGAVDGRAGRGGQSADPRSLFRDGRALVSVLGPDGKLVEREVRVGVMTRVAAQIVSGLAVGETVVIGTKAALRPEAANLGGAMNAGQNQGGRH